jgi:peptide/nickel transport system permease protein
LRLDYVLRRVGLFFIIVWLAASVNFFLPRLTGQDPIREKLMREVKTYEIKFGLDRPFYMQYLNYLGDVLRFDFNYSIAHYPNRVIDMLTDALPWTLGLLTVSFLLSFTLGSLLGALFGWPRTPRYVHWFLGPLLSLSAIPYFLLGLPLRSRSFRRAADLSVELCLALVGTLPSMLLITRFCRRYPSC